MKQHPSSRKPDEPDIV